MSQLTSGQFLRTLLFEAVNRHNVLPVTGICNLSCLFCSHKYNPPGTRAYSFRHLEEKTWRELISLLNPGRKIIIGESATLLREGEPFIHPQIGIILTELRALYPRALIQITTNGTLLDERNLELLHQLKPIELVLSLNSITQAGRELVMKDRDWEKTSRNIDQISKKGIVLHGSIVAMPHITGVDDICETIRALDNAGAVTVRLLVQGFTRFSPPSIVPPPDLEKILTEVIAEMKKEVGAVLLLEPPVISGDLTPKIEGIVAGSPAAKAGVRAGDIVRQVNCSKPLCRVEAHRMINNLTSADLVLQRGKEVYRITLDLKGVHSAGIVFNYDLDPRQIDIVKSYTSKSSEVLMLVSEPALARWIAVSERFGIRGLTLKKVDSLYFGGSIKSAGLLTVNDFQQALNTVRGLSGYDQILLPAIAFDRQGFDLAGTKISELSAGKVPVRLIS